MPIPWFCILSSYCSRYPRHKLKSRNTPLNPFPLIFICNRRKLNEGTLDCERTAPEALTEQALPPFRKMKHNCNNERTWKRK